MNRHAKVKDFIMIYIMSAVMFCKSCRLVYIYIYFLFKFLENKISKRDSGETNKFHILLQNASLVYSQDLFSPQAISFGNTVFCIL